MERKDLFKTIRSCAVMQYFEHYDVEEVAVIESRIKALSNIKTYCFRIHDKDLLESWEPKKKHFHAVLTFSKPTTIWTVAKWLKVEPQYVETIKNTTFSAQLYLIHKNDPDKFQYDPKEVIANFDYMEKIDWVEPKQRKESIAKRIETWEIKQYNLYDYISITEFATNKNYYDRCFTYRQQKMISTHRQLECIFITWPSGTWKTTFAKKLAEEKYWYRAYISSQWKNPLDNYQDQECIILDDLRENVFDFADFLKITDNNTNSLVNCRFFNKSILECKLLIVTTTKDIKDFYNNSINIEWEDIKQLMRRFRTYIVVWKNDIQLYNYNNIAERYDYYNTITNPIAVEFIQNKENVVLNDICTKFWFDIVDDGLTSELKQPVFRSKKNKDDHIVEEVQLIPDL